MILSDKQKFYIKMVKVASGVLGGALIINENHPYIALGILVVGAIANEALNYKNEKT